MHVIATAGHVDHGKSALVKALTGAEPDRLAQEQDRGLSIDLGYAWVSLPGAGQVAFVDVPGHERFISTALGGFGPVPAVLFVVAADDQFMPQAAEHLAALDALGVAHGVLAITRSDLTDPQPAREQARAQLAGTSLEHISDVTVSSRTGVGLSDLRSALTDMLSALPDPDPESPVRLWVDRSFTMTGAGAVVTGTLPAGQVRPGDHLAGPGEQYRVRGVQSLGQSVPVATGVARVALNIVGDEPVERGQVLLTPGAWHHSEALDVQVRPSRLTEQHDPPQRPLLHVGSTVLSAHYRPLGPGLARLTVSRPLPLRIGDRALIRDPGTRRLWGITVLDPAPPPLRRRGAARERAGELTGPQAPADPAIQIERRGLVPVDLLTRIGVATQPLPAGVVTGGGWLLSGARAEASARAAETVVAEHAAHSPMDPGLTLAALTERLGLPDAHLTAQIVPETLRVIGGRVYPPGHQGLPPKVQAAVAALRDDLAGAPFAAPTAERLVELGLDEQVRGAAVRAGMILQPAPGVVLLAGADDLAAEHLADLPQPFTTSEARRHLQTSRRVALALLGHLDRTGRTRRLPDDRRRVTARS